MAATLNIALAVASGDIEGLMETKLSHCFPWVQSLVVNIHTDEVLTIHQRLDLELRKGNITTVSILPHDHSGDRSRTYHRLTRSAR